MVEITKEIFRHLHFPEKNGKKDPVCLYFILDKDQNAVKIGISKKPQERLEYIRATNLNELELLISVVFPQANIRKVERDFHKLFEKYRICGEWFRYNSSIKIAIETLKETSVETDEKAKEQRTNE